MYYRKSVEHVLVQCVSTANQANECFIAILERRKQVITEDEFSKFRNTGIEWANEGYMIPWTIGMDESKNDATRSPQAQATRALRGTVFTHNTRVFVCEKDWNEGKSITLTEYTPRIENIRLTDDTCKFIARGDKGSLVIPEKDPPTRFIDDGSADNARKFEESPCTFLAMLQREMAHGNTMISIKHYYCNDPDKYEETIPWKVFCGRTDVHTLESDKANVIDDRYPRVPGPFTGSLGRFKSRGHTHVFINAFIILHHWARHDAGKGEKADECLWSADTSFSPYDRYYKLSFEQAEETNLCANDFTLSQCLRAWFYAIGHMTEASMKRGRGEYVTGSISIDWMKRILERDIGELNQLLTCATTPDGAAFPDPIYAATDYEPGSAPHSQLLGRARVIFRKAFLNAFPIDAFAKPYIADDMVREDGIINITLATEFLTQEFTSVYIHQSPWILDFYSYDCMNCFEHMLRNERDSGSRFSKVFRFYLRTWYECLVCKANAATRLYPTRWCVIQREMWRSVEEFIGKVYRFRANSYIAVQGEDTVRRRKYIMDTIQLAFPPAEDDPNPIIFDASNFSPNKFMEYMAHAEPRFNLPTHPIPSLARYSVDSLAGSYILADSDAYEVLTQLPQKEALVPAQQNKGCPILIYDSGGVAVAYFHSMGYMQRSRYAEIELDHLSTIPPRDDAERSYREKRFQLHLPVLYYALTKEAAAADAFDDSMYVRAIHRVRFVAL